MSKLFIRTVNNLCTKLLNGHTKCGSNTITSCLPIQKNVNISIHTTAYTRDLMEFFENNYNWGKEEIKVGRSWKKEELRIKSNEDLHKLWYVLLKEKNMLLTMEHESKEHYYLFPNPERIDKVEESMNNLEDVIRERNRAYYLLETGEDGERPGKVVRDRLGRMYVYHTVQHSVPKFLNRKWVESRGHNFNYHEVVQFLQLYREKHKGLQYMRKMRTRRTVLRMLRRFENIDKDYLQEQYPELDIKQLETERDADGPRVPALMK